MSKVSDLCAVCGHSIEVLLRSWEYTTSVATLVICANYCTEDTCGVTDCRKNCRERVEKDPHLEERVRRVMYARRQVCVR